MAIPFAALSLGINIASSVFGARQQREQGAAQGRIDAANLMLTREKIAGENADRRSANQIKAAQGSLARFMMVENNKRLLDNAGKARAAATQTLLRMQDSMVSGSLEDQLSAAEAAGAFTANAAFNGTGGNAVDLIDMTMRLKTARQRAAKEEAQGYASYDQMAQIAGIIPQAVSGLDISSTSDGFDLAESIAGPVSLSPRAPSLLGSALTGALTSPFLGPAVQELGQMFKGTGASSLSGSGFKPGGSTEGFKRSSSFSFNDTGAGTSYRLF